MRASAAPGASLLIAAGRAPCAAQSDAVASCIAAGPCNVYIGVGVGGEYDLQARLVAKYIGRQHPRQPERRADHDRRERAEDAELPTPWRRATAR